MPTYEYECRRCATRFELKKSFGDNGHVSCPNCQGETQRIFTSVPVIFKGSGFYSTDNRPTDYSPPETPAPSAESATANNDTNETETKTTTAEKSD